MEMESFCSNGFVLNELLCSVGQVLVAEAAKSIAFSFLLMGSLPNSAYVLPKPSTVTGFPITDLYAVTKPGSENKDASETEDDEDGDEEGGEDQDDEAGDEEDASGDEVEGKGDPEDVPAANGDGASEEEDDDDEEEKEDDDDDDDDDGDDDGDEETEDDEEDEEDEEDEDDIPQPPAKRRK
ncbi:hypothetical protein RchiOBHm_Chr6g0297441 [Rosa chinensis]|uniref:Uncharacterized protein n=1 Tax=Rosa chinensis TaxID=74649 RepID=A0A2P6PXS4_ROSCH|nr:acidic leucine-rich nuclear phosphoprotein 32 family member B [Rosa chinensis]PRQ26696.1 hypothetical protein RchiOBHm_Chr6g0297441 [Rosa chinensis]